MNLPIYISLSPPPPIPHFLDHPSPFLDHPSPTPQKFQLGLHSIPPKKSKLFYTSPPKMVFDVSPIFHTPSPPPWGTHPYTKNAFIPPNSSKGRCQKHPAGGGGCGFSWSSALHLHPPSIFQLSISSPHFFWLPSPPFLS